MALRSGVQKYGLRDPGFEIGTRTRTSWKLIKNDPEFSIELTRRSHMDLKDKWRNMFRYKKQRSVEPYPEPVILSEGSINTLEEKDGDIIKELLLDGKDTGPLDVCGNDPEIVVKDMVASDEQRNMIMEVTKVVKDIDTTSNSASDENWLGMFKSDNRRVFDLDGYNVNTDDKASDDNWLGMFKSDYRQVFDLDGYMMNINADDEGSDLTDLSLLDGLSIKGVI